MEEYNQSERKESPYQGYSANTSTPDNLNRGEEIARFFKEDLKNMFVSLFKYPASGAQRFLDSSPKSIVNPLCMVLLSFVTITLLSLIVFSIKGAGDFMSFGTYVLFGTFPIVYALFFTLIMFVFMVIKQTPDFKLAFRHTSLHVFLFTVTLSVILISLLFVNVYDILNFSFRNLKAGGFFLMLVVIYAISMGISAVRQTLQSCTADNKEGYAWYIAPLVISLALWLTLTVYKSMAVNSF